MLIDNSNMREIVNIHDFVSKKLQSFTLSHLCYSFNVGKMFYNTTQNLDRDTKPLSFALLIGTVGLFSLVKLIKAEYRTPWQHQITEENKIDVLKTFLSGKGNKDLFSLKFLVIGTLFHIKTQSDIEAKMIVDEVENQLGINSTQPEESIKP